MGNDNKQKSTRNGKDHDKKFRSKHINHDPAAESARAVFGIKEPDQREDRNK